MKLTLALLLCTASAWARTEEKRTLDAQKSAIAAVAFSPDGKLLATAAEPHEESTADGYTDVGDVKVYDVATGKQTRTIAVVAVALRWSPDGKLLAIGTAEDDVFVWDVAANKQRIRFEYGAADGKTKEREHAAGVHRVSALDFTADSKLLAVTYSSADNPVRVYDLAANKRLVRLDTAAVTNQPVYGVAIAPDGKLLATTGGDGKTELWSLPDGKHVATVGPGGATLAFSPDGKKLAVGFSTINDEPALLVYDVASREQIADLSAKHKSVTSLAFSADGKRLASAGSEAFVRVWPMDQKDPTSAQLIGHEGAITCIAISPDGKHVAAGSEDKTVKLWDVPE